MQVQQSTRGPAGTGGDVSANVQQGFSAIGGWTPLDNAPAFTAEQLGSLVSRIREPMVIVRDPASGHVGAALGGDAHLAGTGYQLLATLPPVYPEWLGDRAFCEIHRVRFPYVTGAMANGIATTTMVIEMARAGMLGFFGAAGLDPQRIERALIEMEQALDPQGLSWGSNLIHSPNENGMEQATVELYLRRNVKRVSASAYMSLTPHVVRYAATGLHLDSSGQVQRRNFLFAKVSRPEVGLQFMSPAPKAILDALVKENKLTAEEAELAQRVPVAEDFTLEGDSGGHTDNQALAALFPVMLHLRNQIQEKYQYTRPIRLGAAGGIGTPSAMASAFGLGASFVVTGSINQGAIESGLSESGRALLATTGIADVMMAPAADMFEQGVKVQVLKRGTMFAVRAAKLYEIYSAYPSMDAIPPAERTRLEADLFKCDLDEIWRQTRIFWEARDPKESARADADPKHRMALCFRWYLGQSSRWAISGEADREMDYQIWSGPAMGAFNDWVRGSFLEVPENREVVQIAKNLLEGAAIITRAQQLRTYGVPVPPGAFHFSPTRFA